MAEEYDIMKPAMAMMMIVVMAAIILPLMAEAAPPSPPVEPTPPGPPTQGEATLYGTVADSVTGGAIAGALVSLNDTYTAYSNSVGQYEITGIALGSYTLKFEKAGYYEMATFSITLQEGITRTDAALVPVPQKAGLYGVVTDRATAEALEAVKVTLWATFIDPETGVVIPGYTFTAYTDSNGRYEIGDIGPGGCLLTFEKEGYGAASVDITLPEGITRVDASLVLTPIPTEPLTFSNVSIEKVTFYDAPVYKTIIFHCTITNPSGVNTTRRLDFMGRTRSFKTGATRTMLVWSFELTLAPGESYNFKWDGNTYGQRTPTAYNGPLVPAGNELCVWLEDEQGNKSAEGCVSG